MATMERGQKGKKGNQQDGFQKLLDRPCPLHPKGKHTILECVFTSLSNNTNWKKTKRRKINKMMKKATKMGPWDSNNPPTGST